MKKEYNIDKLVSELDFESNSLVDCGRGIYLTNYEIDVLNKYNINYKGCINLKEIIYYIEDILKDDNSLDDLDIISRSISERDYYQNTNK